MRNPRRYLLSGLVASVVIFVITGIINGAILGPTFQRWMSTVSGFVHPPEPGVQMLLWTLMCVLFGFAGIAVYVWARAVLGAGPKTAFLVGLLIWVISKLTTGLDLIALGLIPQGLVIAQLIGGAVAIILGVIAGAALYKA